MEIINGRPYKQCRRCHEIKFITNFHYDAKAADNLRCNCKQCTAEINRTKKLKYDFRRAKMYREIKG
jgi:hypothetical protein